MTIVLAILQALVAIPKIGELAATLYNWVIGLKKAADKAARERALKEANDALKKVKDPNLTPEEKRIMRREAAKKFRDAISM